MTYLFTTYTAAQLLTGVVAVIVSFFAWQRRKSRGGWPLFLLFVAVSEWALANGMEAAAVPQELKVFWTQVSYFGSQISPPLLLLFTLHYTGKGKRITPLNVGSLFIIPALIIFLAATNDAHGLIWVDFLPGPPGTNSLIFRHGPAFWISIIYIFSVVALANALLFNYAVRTQKVYKQQSWIIILASLLPWAGATLYVFGLNPFPGLDIVSISFFFNGLLILFGITRTRLLDLVPVAYEFVFGNISDAVIVIDDQQRIVDFNPAALEYFTDGSKELIGEPTDQVLGFWGQIEGINDRGNSRKIEIKFQERFLFVRVSPINDQQTRFIGWTVIIEDISLRKNAELDLEKVNQRLQSNIDDINLLQDKLQELVVRDSLTGVYNRRYLDETLSREIARAERNGYPLSLIMMDVDYFKKINDRYGHKMGDDVIAAIGRQLLEQTRDSDCVSRYGGDEFLLVMPEISRENAFERAELWREGIKAMVFQSGDEVINVTISMGIASYPKDGANVDQLVKAADDAMYQAKEKGRDLTVLA